MSRRAYDLPRLPFALVVLTLLAGDIAWLRVAYLIVREVTR